MANGAERPKTNGDATSAEQQSEVAATSDMPAETSDQTADQAKADSPSEHKAPPPAATNDRAEAAVVDKQPKVASAENGAQPTTEPTPVKADETVTASDDNAKQEPRRGWWQRRFL